jgi:hypothetical protein
MAKIAIVYYSMYGHIATMAEEIKAGIEAEGAVCDIYRIPETLSDEILTKMYAPPKNENHPIISNPETLTEYDGIMFGVPGRYGIMAAQVKVRFLCFLVCCQSGALPTCCYVDKILIHHMSYDTDFHGRHGWDMAKGCLARQTGGMFLFHQFTRWGTRNDWIEYGDIFYPPRHVIRPIGL